MINKKNVAVLLALGLLLSIGSVLSYNPLGRTSSDLSNQEDHGQGDVPVLGDWSGKWDMVANTNYKFILDLQPSGNQITGTMTSKDAAFVSVETISGTISGGTIQFTREGAEVTQVYTGSLSGSTITGSFNQNGQGQYPWSASKYIAAQIKEPGVGELKVIDAQLAPHININSVTMAQTAAGNSEPISVSLSVISAATQEGICGLDASNFNIDDPGVIIKDVFPISAVVGNQPPTCDYFLSITPTSSWLTGSHIFNLGYIQGGQQLATIPIFYRI